MSGLQSHPGQGNLACSTWFLPPSDLIQVLGPSLPTGRWRGGDGYQAPHGRLCLCSRLLSPPQEKSPRDICALIPARVSCLGTRLGLTLPPTVSPPNSGDSQRTIEAPVPAAPAAATVPPAQMSARGCFLEFPSLHDARSGTSLLHSPNTRTIQLIRPNSQHRLMNKQVFEKGYLLIRKTTPSTDE